MIVDILSLARPIYTFLDRFFSCVGAGSSRGSSNARLPSYVCIASMYLDAYRPIHSYSRPTLAVENFGEFMPEMTNLRY